MKRVEEKNIVIGDLYWVDEKKTVKGIYVGFFNNSVSFYLIGSAGDFHVEDDGTINFFGSLPNYEYEEVE